MPTESGDMKLLGNYRKLIDHVSADANYNPANPNIQTTALETHYSAALASVDDVAAKSAPSKIAINNRQAAYEPLANLTRRSFNMLKASGASKALLDDAQTNLRKVVGVRKSAKVKDDPNTPEVESDKQHSASQMSFENRRGSFNSYVSILANVPAYNPNETDLKIVALQAVVTDLDAKNNAVNAAFVPLSQARGTRDGLLYTNEDSVVNRALLAKAYVQAAFGRDSPLFKQIRKLDFKRQDR